MISGHQTDVIHFADDLAAWSGVDFEGSERRLPAVTPDRWVPFWSDIATGVDPLCVDRPLLLDWPADSNDLCENLRSELGDA